jgi:hypothetical protein
MGSLFLAYSPSSSSLSLSLSLSFPPSLPSSASSQVPFLDILLFFSRLISQRPSSSFPFPPFFPIKPQKGASPYTDTTRNGGCTCIATISGLQALCPGTMSVYTTTLSNRWGIITTTAYQRWAADLSPLHHYELPLHTTHYTLHYTYRTQALNKVKQLF